ncbi:MAG: DUF2071 domain-containing protein [Verrucomicrobiota bacterium]
MNAPAHILQRTFAETETDAKRRPWIPNNPIPMVGRLSRCWLLAYRAPLDLVRRHLPAPLKPLSFGGYGFWNVVVCEIENMRPRGLPSIMGITYRHAAYRIYVRHLNDAGTSVEGLYFLRSDCDSPLLTAGGNVLTDFKFHSGDITIAENPLATLLEVKSKGANGQATIHYGHHAKLAEGSPFQSVQEAGDFLEYTPHGISVSPHGGVEVLPIRRNEADWKPRVVAAQSDHWDYLANDETHLEIAYEVAPIDYEWLPAQHL